MAENVTLTLSNSFRSATSMRVSDPMSSTSFCILGSYTFSSPSVCGVDNASAVLYRLWLPVHRLQAIKLGADNVGLKHHMKELNRL